MRYLLDTNSVIALLKDAESPVARRARRVPVGDIVLSVIGLHELFYGAFKSRRAAENAALVEAIEFAVLPFEPEDARRAGKIRAFLATAGAPIGPYDVLIAGQAAARNLALVTHNTGEFARAPGLRVTDWQR